MLAYDLSREAERAVDVVAASAWPPETSVWIVTSPNGVAGGLSSFAGIQEARGHERAVHTTIDAAQAEAAERLAAAGLIVETAILPGPPARAVLQQAEDVAANLIVAGARAQPSIFATLLGSVSTEISEGARCPVLIARVESLERVIVATDGSPAARAAVELVAQWPLFAGARIRVIGVASAHSPVHYAASVLSEAGIEEPHLEDIAGARQVALDAVEVAVARLMDNGRRAAGHVRSGQAGEEIVAAAREWPADLVVIGATGASLARRLMLSSVTRSVLHGVPSSVLVVPPGEGEPRTGTPPEGD